MTSTIVAVKLEDQTAFLTVTCNGETIESLGRRIEEIHHIPKNRQRLYICAESSDSSDAWNQMTNHSSCCDANCDEMESRFRNTKEGWMSFAFSYAETTISHLMPSLSSLMDRKIIVEYIKKTLNRCLGARVFCIGSSMNNIFLPNEPIELTPFLCKGQEERWFLRVTEGLCLSTLAGSSPDIDLANISVDCKSTKIMLSVNNNEVSIIHNELSALYFGALIEDMNKFIGSECLLKKSFMLIKAWCCYDSTQFFAASQTSVFSILKSAMVIHIMILHLFSVYGKSIEHPLRALGLFLKYYSSVDWDSVVVTVSELRSAKDMSILQNNLEITPDKSKIDALLEAYRRRFEATLYASMKVRMGDDSLEDFASTDEGAKNYEMRVPNIDEVPVVPQHCVDSFVPSFMSVMHPLKPDCNLTKHLTKSQVGELKAAFKCGLRSLKIAAEKCSKILPGEYGKIDAGMGITVDVGSYFIANFLSRTHDMATREHMKSKEEVGFSEQDLKKSKYFCENEEPEAVMRHAELIMGSKITPDAVANLIVHIVEQAGPHPIGEIGKLLQEATGSPNLSRVLKAQFRGLKKLIEGYPHMLKLGGDHSFNPHVYLADSYQSGNTESGMIRDQKVENTNGSPLISESRSSNSSASSQPKSYGYSHVVSMNSGGENRAPGLPSNSIDIGAGQWENRQYLGSPGMYMKKYGLQSGGNSNLNSTFESSNSTVSDFKLNGTEKQRKSVSMGPPKDKLPELRSWSPNLWAPNQNQRSITLTQEGGPRVPSGSYQCDEQKYGFLNSNNSADTMWGKSYGGSMLNAENGNFSGLANNGEQGEFYPWSQFDSSSFLNSKKLSMSGSVIRNSGVHDGSSISFNGGNVVSTESSPNSGSRNSSTSSPSLGPFHSQFDANLSLHGQNLYQFDTLDCQDISPFLRSLNM